MNVHQALLRGHLAPSPRTLIDVLYATAAENPQAEAIDDGRVTLTYAELMLAIDAGSLGLERAGVRSGDRVGVRIPSGTAELYIAILSVLAVGAAYVPVDVDDPDERARTVFREAAVVLVLGEGDLAADAAGGSRRPVPPALQDDAWIIFTSGSTGTPKGVAVSHRSAAAFVDAEARLFLSDSPLGPGDRVLAGLSVAFDASCEEMWLAWRNGACLVPAPRALVRTGADLGPWLVSERISVISTVPTLAGMWSPDELGGIRLLIFGGEACPPELAARLVSPGREVWNTYGPTEATVVACAALLDGVQPVRIGLPLDGWNLAVVDDQGKRVADGDIGELLIGGVGLARYLDAEMDSEKYASAPCLGWERAYRSGDLVRFDGMGLLFVGRADDQVKVGGRRIELGEIDAALAALPGVAASAAAVRITASGVAILVGYIAAAEHADIDLVASRERLRATLPPPLVPLLTSVNSIPTRTSGKVDRDALPWPIANEGPDDGVNTALTATEAWVAGHWTSILGARVSSPEEDFFASGGGSLLAARLVSQLRERFPTVTVADVYDYPRLSDLALRLEELAPAPESKGLLAAEIPRGARILQSALTLPLAAVVGLRWLTWLLLANAAMSATGTSTSLRHAPYSLAWGLVGWAVLISPWGRMGTTVLVARTVLWGVRPGRYPRAGGVHLRLWFAESWATAAGVGNLSCAPWTSVYARLLGAKIGKDVDLHSMPPITGHLVLGNGCSVEPEVDLSGHWLDGDVLVLGKVRIDKRATVGTRSTLGPGSRIGQGAEVAPGSAVTGSVPPGESWAGSPARLVGAARGNWPHRKAPRHHFWPWAYGSSAIVLSGLPLVAAVAGAGAAVFASSAAAFSGSAWLAIAWSPLAAIVAFAVLIVTTWALVRLLAVGIIEGHHPVRSRTGWQIWATLRLMDEARTSLYPLYASSLTPSWLRALGARIGHGVEASTVLMLPSMSRVGNGAFLADDTLVGSYELGRGWMRVERARVGARAFLGNSGMIAPGRAVPKKGLVAVLSSTPRKAKSGTSWLGLPPKQLRRVPTKADTVRTFDPPSRLRWARGAIEAGRLVAVMVSFTLGVSVLIALQTLVEALGLGLAAVLSAGVVVVAAAAASGIAVATKWALVGRIRAGEHPLWSSFIWRNELADAFLEVVAAPWQSVVTMGSPALNLLLKGLGARIGRGVWCETYWLPEADLVTIGAGATINRGCVLQTHLFHDRVMSVDAVTIGQGASIGPHGVVLPAASIGSGASVGPSSLVLRGDAIPGGSRWTGNPVGPEAS